MSEMTVGPHVEITVSRDFSKIYPGASVGVLILENLNTRSRISNLDAIKKEIILDLQKHFPDQGVLKEDSVIQAYSKYYRKFDKSYHVLGQLKSVIFDNRQLPPGSGLVDIVFTAELKNKLLTALHDLDTIRFPMEIGISTGEEIYTTLEGAEKQLKPVDMMVRDQIGVISSVIYGPDKRTCVTPATSSALIVVYAPNGITRENILYHFEDIENLVKMVSPDFKVTLRPIFPID